MNRQKGLFLILSLGAVFLIAAKAFGFASASVQAVAYQSYLPLIEKSLPPTPTPTPTPTPVPSPTPTPTPVTSGNITIVSIFYDGAGSQEPDEYVVIRNDDTRVI
jgi:hypothetical protein